MFDKCLSDPWGPGVHGEVQAGRPCHLPGGTDQVDAPCPAAPPDPGAALGGPPELPVVLTLGPSSPLPPPLRSRCGHYREGCGRSGEGCGHRGEGWGGAEEPSTFSVVSFCSATSGARKNAL